MVSSTISQLHLHDRYRILRPLGQGGMGKTYIAEDTQRPGNPHCVVKHLQPADSGPEFLAITRQMFNEEAKILEQLGRQHAQIPQLLAYFEEDGEFYLIQDYIEGNSLTKELASPQPWTEAEVIQWLQEILGILTCVHAHGIIHRDIKPDNIIRDRAGNLHLIDFGAVKQIRLHSAVQSQLSRLTVSVGTHGYMPTEQAKGKPRLSSDIYAIGIIAIQALTGIRPDELEEDEAGELIWQTQQLPTPVSDRLATFINQMVKYHFNSRFKDAQQALDKLQELTPTPPNPNTDTHKNPTTQQTVVAAPAKDTTQDNAAAPSQTPKNYQPWLIATGITIAAIGTLLSTHYGINQTQKATISGSIDQLNQSHQFDACISQAENAILKMPELQPELQQKVDKCRNNKGKDQLEKAKQYHEKGQYLEAVELITQIDKSTDSQAEVQSLLVQWSVQIVENATKLYDQGKIPDFKKAITMLSQLPKSSPKYEHAQKLIREWQGAEKENQEHMESGYQALQKNRFDAASSAASFLTYIPQVAPKADNKAGHG
jgi:serine/threonine protein kinase, bacterial